MPHRESGKLTVVVPTYNGEELLRACLRSLQVQTRSCQVLVVDDASEDQTPAMLRGEFPDVRYLRLPRNLGFAAAANQGLRDCRTEFAALLNNDTEVAPGWVASGLEAFSRYPQYGFFACRMLQHANRHLLDGAGDVYTRTGLALKRGHGRPADRFQEDGPVLGASAGAAFYRMKVFDEVGFLDETYHMYLEDVEWSLRAQAFGWPCLYLHQAVVYHHEAASDPTLPAERRNQRISGLYSEKRVYWITRNRWQLMFTYQPLRHLPWLIWGWAKSSLFHLFRAGFFGSFLKGSVAGWACLPRALRKRFLLSRSRRLSRSQLCQLIRRS